MPDFGIGEGIAALVGALGAGEAAAAPFEAGALGAAEGLGGGLASGASLGGALDATGALGAFGGGTELGGVAGFGTGVGEALGAPTAALTVNALPGFGGAEALGGAAAGAGAAIGADSFAGRFDPSVSQPFTQMPGVGQGLTSVPGVGGEAAPGVTAPTAATPQPVQPSGTGASSFAPPPGTTGLATPDPTAAASLDQASVNTAATAPLAGPSPASITPPGATVAGGAPTATGGEQSLLDKLGAGAVKSVTNNPIGTALGVGGLGYALSQGQKQSAPVKALQAEAAPLSAQGQQLASYLSSGTLPPGLQASVDQATAGAKSHAIANAAAQGLPTDPTKNTALAEELNRIDAMVPQLTAQLGQQLLTAGVAESGLSSQIYQQLAQIDQTQTSSMGKAIANFAAALSPGGTKIQIGGTSA